MATVQDIIPHVKHGETAQNIIDTIRDLNFTKANGRLRPGQLSLDDALAELRAETENPTLTFQTCTLDDFRDTFLIPESLDGVTRIALDTYIALEQMVELARTMTGLPSENS